MVYLKGWRYGLFIGTIVGPIGIHCYFTMIQPMINPEPYKLKREQVDQALKQRID